MNQDLQMPEGLSEQGKQAYKVIFDFLTKRGLTHTGGCKVFYSPEEWEEREEEYGTDSVLVVVYDGAEARQCFSMDACYERGSIGKNCYEPVESLQKELEAIGMHFEECTGWFSAVYPN